MHCFLFTVREDRRHVSLWDGAADRPGAIRAANSPSGTGRSANAKSGGDGDDLNEDTIIRAARHIDAASAHSTRDQLVACEVLWDYGVTFNRWGRQP